MPANEYADLSTPQHELARRLNLVLDVAVAEGGTPITFREIADALSAEGIRLSRARWAYMISGKGPLVTDLALLTALARVLDVDPDYLIGTGHAVPERIGAGFESLRRLRTRRVREFAARSLIDVAPDTLRSITRLLEADERRASPIAG